MEYRLSPRRYSEPCAANGGLPVRLSEDVRRAVVFLGWQKAGPVDQAPIDPKGTGFLLTAVPSMPNALFLVTARHVAEKLTPPFVVRINTRNGGGVALLHFERPEDADWCFHEDDTVDLAVLAINAPTGFEGSALGADGLFDPARDPAIWSELDAGDTVGVVSLFHFVAGDRKNLPIIHAGHIALLPGDERIPIGGKLVEGYLVQANAISGCSGSPVFVVPWAGIKVGDKKLITLSGYASLMGIWSSSWKVEKTQIVAVRTDDDDEKGTAAPLGMGVVVPAKKLVDILKSEKLRLQQARLDARNAASRSPTHDSLSSSEESASQPKADNPTHAEDFRSLLDAAAKTKTQGDGT